MFKKSLILILLLSVILFVSLNIDYQNINEDEFLKVEIKGAVEEDKVLYVKKGAILQDVLNEVELLDNSDTSSLSLNTTLYNNQIIVIPEVKDEKLVSINSASLTELTTLPGIGEKTALKIIDYRETVGSFNSLEDIMNVSGIGEAKYQKIKDFITL